MYLAENVKKLESSYIREILAAASASEILSLAGGLPAEDSFPMDLIGQALLNVSKQPKLFQYGHTLGYPPLLEVLSNRYQVDNNLCSMICNGSQQALDLVCRTMLNPRDKVLIEVPSYLGAIQVLSLIGADVVAIEQKADGPNIEQLRQTLSSNDIRIFYCVPDFHNPTGVCWSREVRQQVAELCVLNNVLLVEDVPYREIRFFGDQLPLVSSFYPHNSIVLRSFSKIASPGMRLGMLTSPGQIMDNILIVKQATDLHTNIPLQALLAKLLSDQAFNTHLLNVVNQYREKYKAMTLAISEHLDQVRFCPVEGGMFIWVALPGWCNAMSVAKRAVDQGVAVVPGNVFYPKHLRSKCPPFLRLNFSHLDKARFNDAISRLSLSIQNQ